MTYYRISAKLMAPLSVQGSRKSDARQSLPYLPGTSFRGAVAAKILRSGGDPESEEFKTLFLNDPPCFPNLLPSDENGLAISRILPLTARSCKRHKGFRNAGNHGVGDGLARILIDRNRPGLLPPWSCSECGEDMKGISTFWNGDPTSPVFFEPTMFYRRHTGIDRKTGTIAPEIFFITQAIADFRKVEGDGEAPEDPFVRQTLAGGMHLNERQYGALTPILEGSLFAGSSKTRGMGEIEVEIVPAEENIPDVQGWSRDFESLLENATEGERIPELPSGVFFSITLESHAIFVDEFLRPTPELSLDFPEIQPVVKVVRSETIQGWSDAWGLSKPDDTGVSMGSVYLFCYTGQDREGLRDFLTRTQTDGIGLRREEGFGRARICDPFHATKEEAI